MVTKLQQNMRTLEMPSEIEIRRYVDRCYAVIDGAKRGPCAHDKPTALRRWERSGCIASAASDKTHKGEKEIVRRKIASKLL